MGHGAHFHGNRISTSILYLLFGLELRMSPEREDVRTFATTHPLPMPSFSDN